jgi:hypothetical protein
MKNLKYKKYLAYNIICGYTIFNDNRGYEELEHVLVPLKYMLCDIIVDYKLHTKSIITNYKAKLHHGKDGLDFRYFEK